MKLDEAEIIDLTRERALRAGSPQGDDLMAIVWLHRNGTATTWTADDLDTDSIHNQEVIEEILGRTAREIMGRR